MGLVLEAWQELDSCRHLGYGYAGPIPTTAVYEWADRNDIDAELAVILVAVIRHLDAMRAERIASELANKE